MLEDILSSCKFVSKNSKHVKINHDKVDEIAESLDVTNNKHWLEIFPFGILDFDVESIVNFLLVYHSIGFSFWGTPKWTIKTENEEFDGSFAMMYRLTNELKDNKDFFSASYLKDMPFEKIKNLLEGNVEIPLLKERHNNLINIGRVIEQNMKGNFYNFVKDVYSDIELFNIIVNNFSEVFNDIAIYNGKEIPFYKLAQLLVSDILHARKLKEKVEVDYSNLVGCADYKVPQVLRSLEVLEYNKELSDLIDNKKEIESGSDYEIEIRANMIVAVNEINKRVKNTCPIEVNDLIWLKGQEKNGNIKPYHLTRTRFY